MIHYPISNYYMKVKLYYVNGVAKTEICQTVILQVSICEINIDIINKDTNGFSMEYYDNLFY